MTTNITNPNFNPSESEAIDNIERGALHLQRVIVANTPEGRRRSLALIHLGTCSMFAVKAAAVGDGE